MTATNRGGRPKSYSHDDLARAVALAEARGHAATPAAVRAVLCSELGISPTIRAEPFERALEAYLAERDRAREEEVIAGLPEAERAELRQVAAQLERTLALACGSHAARVEADLVARLRGEARHRSELLCRIEELRGEAARAADRIAALCVGKGVVAQLGLRPSSLLCHARLRASRPPPLLLAG